MSLQIKMIYPYYENPSMLNLQVRNWNSYSDDAKARTELFIVDDGSPDKDAAQSILKNCDLNYRLYRVIPNIPWNQHGARNLGAKEAGKGWLYMSDMDILLPPKAIDTILDYPVQTDHHYTFDRVFANNSREPKYHCNTFLVHNTKYWEIGGYDEDYCGTYGGDGPFLRQLEVVASRHHINYITLVGHERDSINDANTTEWDRYGPMKDAYREKLKQKNKSGDIKAKNPIRFKWERIV